MPDGCDCQEVGLGTDPSTRFKTVLHLQFLDILRVVETQGYAGMLKPFSLMLPGVFEEDHTPFATPGLFMFPCTNPGVGSPKGPTSGTTSIPVGDVLLGMG